ncbi:ankyrin repeat-containing domain protein [Ochromonadaceae sp. CCMP2298]|nr:ankyrin repeat-containing domain protein [Ochromonadaceae sp. CCMP2298]
MMSVVHLVTGSGYLVDERQLLGICKAAYDNTQLLRIVLQIEKERRNKLHWCEKKFRPSGPNSRTLLSYACEREDTERIQLLMSLGASTCFYCLPQAVELGRFEIAELLLAHDPTAIDYLLNTGFDVPMECRENIVRFAGLPGVTASNKVDLGLIYNLPQLITDNLDEWEEGHEWVGWVEGHDWPVKKYLADDSYEYDDPLHLREAGYVWIGVLDEFDFYLFESLYMYGDYESEALQALSMHPAFSPADCMVLASKVKDAEWVMRLIQSNQHNSPDKALSNDRILFGACCAGLTQVALDMLELGASPNASGYLTENMAVLQAAWNEDEQLLRAMYDHGCYVDVALLAACYMGLRDMVAEVLNLGMVGVNANMSNDNMGILSVLYQDSHSAETPLLIACARGHIQLMRYLFQCGAVFDEVTAERLHYYRDIGTVGVEVLRVLMEHVDVHILRNKQLYENDDEESKLLLHGAG